MHARNSRRPRHLSRLLGMALGGALFAAAGCAPAISRPARGAVPGADYPTPAPLVPPTLSVGGSGDLRLRALPDPSPGLTGSPSPSAVASPSPNPLPPIVRSVQPGA